jgi:Tol biopolymer transport system component
MIRRSWFGILALLAATVAVAQTGSPFRHGSMPSVSPDGRQVVFSSERDSVWELYSVRPDGSSLRRLTHTPEEELVPDWTHDGRLVAMFVAGDRTRLHVIGADGSSTVLAEQRAVGMAISNDGRRIAYGVGTWGRNRVYVADRDGSHARALTDSSCSWFNLAWSPDDRMLAAARTDSARNLQVWLIDVDDVGRRALTHFAQRDGRPQWPAWSPDGKKIAIQAGLYDRDHPERSDAYIWVVDVASGRATRLGSHDRPWLDETPSWFPDGKRIAYQSTRTGPMEIWVVDADGTDSRPITR